MFVNFLGGFWVKIWFGRDLGGFPSILKVFGSIWTFFKILTFCDFICILQVILGHACFFFNRSIFGASFGPPDLSDEYRSEILRPGTSRRPQNSLSGPIFLGFVTLTLFSPRTRIVNIRRNNIVQACRKIWGNYRNRNIGIAVSFMIYGRYFWVV